MQFFATPDEWRAWLEAHHATETELLVGFWKKESGKPSMTWSESVDQALCFGWIDAVRRRVDDESYTIRFTRRKPGSTWSAINVAKIAELQAKGLMRPAGEAAFAHRKEHRTAIYAYEQGDIEFDETDLRANPDAWAWWEKQGAGYRKQASHWVVSAKRPETRAKRMAELVEDCGLGRKIKSQRWG